MRFFVIIIASILVLGSCNYKEQKHPGYSYNEKGYYFQLLSFNEEFGEIKASDFVTASVEFYINDKDSVLTSEQFIMQIQPSDSVCIADLFIHLRQGDSAAFITPNFECIRDVLIPEFSELLNNEEELTFTIKVNKVQTQEQYVKQQYEYNLWLKNKRDFEYNTIESYIAQQKKAFVKLPNGIYKFILHNGIGDLPQKGEVVTIRYQGSDLSGDIINHFTTLEFTLGAEWQVIKGVELAMQTMRVGERAMVIIPSEYAWGAEGSSNKEIKGFTTVVYDLQIISSKPKELN